MNKHKIIGIYKITSPTGRIYVGQSVNVRDRERKYSQCNCKNQVRLHRSILKYGWANHVFELIEECYFEELNKRERHWQEFYNCMDKKTGLNCNLTGTNELKKVHSEETKKKIGMSNKGRICSIEDRLKMSERMKGRFAGEKHPLFGKKFTDEQRERNRLSKIGNKYRVGKIHSAETRRKLSEANTGFKHSEETKRKISKANLNRSAEANRKISVGLQGHYVSPETRKKISDWHTGKIRSEEARRNMSKAQMGKKQSKETIEKRRVAISGEKNFRAKLIVNVETGIFYGCIKEAAKAHNIYKSTLNGYLIGARKNKTSLCYV